MNLREIVCDTCGKIYQHWQWQSKFCSKECYHKAAYRKVQERVCARDYQLRKVYGISLEDYEAMLLSQNGVCAICKEQEICVQKDGKLYPLCVDHDHSTGEVRKLLCRRCNMAMGLIREDLDILNNMKTYLESFKQLKAVKGQS